MMLGKLNICNPGNIRQSGDLFIGEVRPSTDAAFKQFSDNVYGYRAMFKVLSAYRTYGIDSIEQIINRYSEDNQQSYAHFVSQKTGIPIFQSLQNDKSTMTSVVAAMSELENGVKPNIQEIEDGWNLSQNIELAKKAAIGVSLPIIAGIIAFIIYKSRK